MGLYVRKRHWRDGCHYIFNKAQIYVDFLDTFLIPSIERMFGDDEIIFEDDNASKLWKHSLKKDT